MLFRRKPTSLPLLHGQFNRNTHLHRSYALCDDATVELVLVSRLGLEGLDYLCILIQAVPQAFMEKRVPFITNMMNSVLSACSREPINEGLCEVLISLCAKDTYIGSPP